MNTSPIREESGMLFLRREDFNLFDIEPLIQNHPDEHWRKLPTPEFVLWNEKEICIIEAKSSVPRKTSLNTKERESHNKDGFVLVTNYEDYCARLFSKFTTALIVLRPDVLDLALDCQHTSTKPPVQNVDKLRRMRLRDVPTIRLVLVLKGVPDDVVCHFQEDIRNKLAYSIRPWQPNAVIYAMNEKMTAKKNS